MPHSGSPFFVVSMVSLSSQDIMVKLQLRTSIEDSQVNGCMYYHKYEEYVGVLFVESLAKWKESGKRGVWLTIPLDQSELISVAAKVG